MVHLGLPPRSRQFHITLGFSPSDLHGPSVDKGLAALLVQPLDTAAQALLIPTGELSIGGTSGGWPSQHIWLSAL